MNREVEDVLSLGNEIKVCNDLFLCRNRVSRIVDEEGARILKQIGETSSIRDAAEKIGRDYHAVWAKINSMEKACGMKLVERFLGGVGGGYARLTFAGGFLLQKYETAKRRLSILADQALKPDLTIIGSHCPGLEVLVEMLEERGMRVEYMYAGSLIGLELVHKGLADISGIHLFDKATGEYNSFLLRNRRYRGKLAIIKGYVRRQGLIFRRGNPKGIKSLDDALRRNITFINRNKGSGTRLLTDYLLEKLAEEKGVSPRKIVGLIKGYGNEVRSHFEVVMMIKHGKADLGVGLQASAHRYGLGFIPLLDEEFDFILRRRELGRDTIRKFMEVLKSKEFEIRVSKNLVGISLGRDAGRIVVR